MCHLLTAGQIKSNTTYINPTGTYKLDSKTIKKNGETYGYFGDMKIKLLENSKIVLSLFVCKGAPSYNLGSFVDTLAYQNNIAIYTPEWDSTCKITFYFKKKGITVDQYQDNLNFGCGFGHGVFADGFYKKTSSKTPIIKNDEEELEGEE